MTRTLALTASAYVRGLFSRQLPRWILYHDYKHTVEVVKACRKIGRGVGLHPEDLDVVILAAWFHDTGYTRTHHGHEVESAHIAARFLEKHEVCPDTIGVICRCIMATRMPQRPATMLDAVLCDGDLSFLGTRQFFQSNELLRREIENRDHTRISAMRWLRRTREFVVGHRFHTRFARELFAAQRRSILAQLAITLKHQARSKNGSAPGPATGAHRAKKPRSRCQPRS